MRHRIEWDRYSGYTSVERSTDEKKAKPTPGYCPICDRKSPCRFHEKGPGASSVPRP